MSSETERHRENDDMEDGDKRTSRHRKTKTEAERCYIYKKYMNELREQSEQAQERRTWRMKTRCADCKQENGEREYIT